MRRLLFALGCFGLVMFSSRLGWSQTTLKGYLESCKPQECDNAQSLTCGGFGADAICVSMCDARLPVCPRNEPCAIQADGQGACLCAADADCQTPLKCQNGQCAGTIASGQPCGVDRLCGRGMLCVQLGSETQTYCRPMCGLAGKVCKDGEPCISHQASSFPVCYCSKNEDCPDAKNCVSGRCVIPPTYGGACDDLVGCRRGLVCTQVLGSKERYCLPPCGSGACVGGERCFDASNRQRICACTENDPCPAGIPCTNGACLDRPRCDDVEKCAEGSYCLSLKVGAYGGICRPRCFAKKDCSADDTPCKNVQGVLLCACTVDQDCPSGQVCSQYRCSKANIAEPVEPVEPTEPTETVEEGGEPAEEKPPVEKTPIESNLLPCNPACTGKQRCVSGKCQTLGWKEFCELDSDCASGFCFSADARVKICSTKDCNQCGLLGLQCLQGNGQEGCYYPPYIAPVPDTGQTTSCNCDASEPMGWPLWMLLFFLVGVSRWRRRGYRAISGGYGVRALRDKM